MHVCTYVYIYTHSSTHTYTDDRLRSQKAKGPARPKWAGKGPSR